MPAADATIAGYAWAIANHQPLPATDEQYALDRAYELQHLVTAQRSPNGASGVKLGVTNPQVQAFLSLDHGLLGSLYADTRLKTGDTIPFLAGRSLETEFAVLVDGAGKPKAIAPAIEIVFVSFERQSDMSASNLVLSNLGADLFLVGEFLPWGSQHEGITATLRRDGDVVNEASMDESLGGPTRALPWVWQEIRARGYSAEDETLIMMGACGAVVPAERGSYAADYGPMGSIEFSVS